MGLVIAILTLQEKQEVLDAHNYFREQTALGHQQGYDDMLPKSSKMNRMYWDSGLATLAQLRSDNCVQGHMGTDSFINQWAKDHSDQFQFTSKQYIPVMENQASYSRWGINSTWYGVQAWWNEGKGFQWNPPTCHYQQCGHWFQIVYGEARYVGCAQSYCPKGLIGNKAMKYVLTCNYYPRFDPTKHPYYSTIHDVLIGYWCLGIDSSCIIHGLCDGGISTSYYLDYSRTINRCDDGLGREVPCLNHDSCSNLQRAS